MKKFAEHAAGLYEQEPGEACPSARLGLYVQHWIRWARSGLEHFAHEKQSVALQGPSGCIPDKLPIREITDTVEIDVVDRGH